MPLAALDVLAKVRKQAQAWRCRLGQKGLHGGRLARRFEPPA